jgi:hypothetical protein
MLGIMVDSWKSEKKPFPTVRNVLSRRTGQTRSDLEQRINRVAGTQADKLLGEIMDWHVVAKNPHEFRYSYFGRARKVLDYSNWDMLQVNHVPEIPRPDFPDWQLAYIGGALQVRAALLDRAFLLMAADHPRLQPIGRWTEILAGYRLLGMDATSWAQKHAGAWERYAPYALELEVELAWRSGELTTDERDEILEGVSAADLKPGLAYYDGFTGEYAPSFLEVLEEVGAYIEASQVAPSRHEARLDRIAQCPSTPVEWNFGVG